MPFLVIWKYYRGKIESRLVFIEFAGKRNEKLGRDSGPFLGVGSMGNLLRHVPGARRVAKHAANRPWSQSSEKEKTKKKKSSSVHSVIW